MQEFFAMGGYAFYVWGSFGVTAVLMILEVILLRRRKQQLIRRLGRSVRARNQRRPVQSEENGAAS
jgi:heme exporter protein D